MEALSKDCDYIDKICRTFYIAMSDPMTVNDHVVRAFFEFVGIDSFDYVGMHNNLKNFVVVFSSFEIADKLIHMPTGAFKYINVWFDQWYRLYDNDLLNNFKELNEDVKWGILEKCDLLDLFNIIKFDSRFQGMSKMWNCLKVDPSCVQRPFGIVNLRSLFKLIGERISKCIISFHSIRKTTFSGYFEKIATLHYIASYTGSNLKYVRLEGFIFSEYEIKQARFLIDKIMKRGIQLIFEG